MVKQDKVKVGKHTYTRTRNVGARPAPDGEKLMPFPVRVRASLAAAVDKKRGKLSRRKAVAEALELWLSMDDVSIRTMLYTETS